MTEALTWQKYSDDLCFLKCKSCGKSHAAIRNHAGDIWVSINFVCNQKIPGRYSMNVHQTMQEAIDDISSLFADKL